MEIVQQPSIDDMAKEIKEAVRNNSLFLVEDFPRDAFIRAASDGIARYHTELVIWGETLKVRQFELEKNARIELLSEEEREQAINLANDWLDEHFSK